MLYFVRCNRGISLPIFTFSGALRHLRDCGPDATVRTITGILVAARMQETCS